MSRALLGSRSRLNSGKRASTLSPHSAGKGVHERRSIRPITVMLMHMRMWTEWVLPMARRVYWAETQSQGRVVRRSASGRRCHTRAATIGGVEHQGHIHGGVSTLVKALFSSKAETPMRPPQTWRRERLSPPRNPWADLVRGSAHI